MSWKVCSSEVKQVNYKYSRSKESRSNGDIRVKPTTRSHVVRWHELSEFPSNIIYLITSLWIDLQTQLINSSCKIIVMRCRLNKLFMFIDTKLHLVPLSNIYKQPHQFSANSDHHVVSNTENVKSSQSNILLSAEKYCS